MATFKDAFGRSWHFRIDGVALRQICNATGVNLADMREFGAVLSRLHADLLFVAEVAAALAKEQLEQQSISPAAFMQGVTGDALPAAREAILESLRDFFPNARPRQLIERLLKNPDLWGTSSSTSQASSESTQADSASASSS